MRSIHFGVLLALMLSLLMVSGVMAQDGKWFDMENCDMCKPMMEQPGLLEHTTWEHHNISNGIVAVTTVAPEFMPQYEKARAGMEAVSKKMMAGEEVQLCPMCTAMGACFAKGLKSESVQTKFGDVTLMTSSDAAVVSEIQAWAKRTNDEMAKMEAASMKESEEK